MRGIYWVSGTAASVIAQLLWPAAVVADDTDNVPLGVTIRPGSTAGQAQDFQSSYVPLSDGSVIDFSGWMAQKYGLAGWVSDAAQQDQATGRTALIVYGLGRVAPESFEEDAYSRVSKLPGCGALAGLLWGGSSCNANWQRTKLGLTGEGPLKPQMVGLLDFNDFTAYTSADRELGKIRFTAPPTSLSLVP